MVRFVTLLVGLVTGLQAVEVSVSGPVTRVELRVDGVVVGERRVEPWVFRHDFGREPRPSAVEVVAFDTAGREVSRDRQRINLPGRAAEAAIVPELNESGRVVAARLTWRSPERGDPRRIRVEIDGRRVDATFPWRIDLQGYPPTEAHLLEAAFDFGGGLVLDRQLAFGRGFSGEYVSGLTAVAVELDDLSELPPAADLASWFRAGGRSVEVAAVEHGPAEVVIVRHGGVGQALEVLDRERREQRRREGGDRRPDRLDDDASLWVMLAEPVVGDPGAGAAALFFPVSERSTPGDRGILAAALGPGVGRMMTSSQRLGNAVALAGLRAAEGDRRRAVVVLVGPDRPDESFVSAGAVRGFLSDLTVPLEVWDLTGADDHPQRGWEPTRTVADLQDLRRAARQLRSRLERQRILWVVGEHLPQSIELGPAARGVRIVR